MNELTGERSVAAAWAKFVEPSDIVGIKINPSGAPACCSSPEIVREIINGVQSAGVPVGNIVVYDRYEYEIDIGSYQALLPPGVRVVGIQDGLVDSGYDAKVYCQATFFGEWENRSYMASIVARGLTKIINVPTMKDHSASGVTGCLKNLGYGTFNNVARSHRSPFSFTDPLIGVMCSVEPLRSKAVLHIMDGMRQVWHGGPLTQVQDFIHQAGILYFGTDPVAMDTVELEAIEKKRRDEGAPSRLGAQCREHHHATAMSFTTIPQKNLFYRRPGHIASAGKLGLGVADLKRIDHGQIAPRLTDPMQGPPKTTEPSTAENDWPTLLYDNSRTGGQGIRAARAPDHVRWHIRMGSSVRSAPVLRAGVLYVTSMAGNLHAIDVEKGRQKWQFQAADHIHSTPSLSGNKVLFGCDSGKVYAVDCDSGKAGVGDNRSRGSLDLARHSPWRGFFRQRRCPHLCR